LGSLENFCADVMCRMERQMIDADDDAADHLKEVIAVQNLSDAQLLHILQLADDNDALTRMVEAEIARRRQGGRYQ